MKKLLVVLCLLAPGTAWSLKVEKITGVLASGKPMEVIAEEALVKFSSMTDASQRAALLNPYSMSLSAGLSAKDWSIVRLPGGMPVASGIEILRKLPGVEMVQPNHYYRITRTPNDAFVSSQYALSQINASGAWEFEVGTSCRATIAVIDAGIQGTHSDLSSKLVSFPGVLESQFFDPNSAGAQAVNQPPTPACNHATRVAGIAAAVTNNGIGIAGMSWGAQLISLKVFNNVNCNPAGDCPSSCGTTDVAIANAMDYIVPFENTAEAGKIVINLSVGGTGSCPGSCPGVDCMALTQAAITNATAAGIPVVISAGNDAGAVNVPANCAGTTGGTGIIPVGATDSLNNIAVFSSNGPELAANGVVAPGVAVLTSDLNNGTAQATGTSFSAPHVAGLAALILAAKPTCGGINCAVFVQNTLRAGAENIGVSSLGLDAGGRPLGNLSGAGRINAFRSVRLAVHGTLADFAGDQEPIAFPNPFRTSQTGTVSFSIPLSLQGKQSKIRIYTMSGEFINEVSGLTWDGRNKLGNPVATGTYIFVVSTDKGTSRGRVALIR